MMGAVLNGFPLADFHSIIAIDRWRSRYRDRMPAWLDRIFAFDELNSFAGFAFNHPGYCYPEVIGKPLEAPEPFLAARQLGHPLISTHHCIPNDFSPAPQAKVEILPGHNMSGQTNLNSTESSIGK